MSQSIRFILPSAHEKARLSPGLSPQPLGTCGQFIQLPNVVGYWWRVKLILYRILHLEEGTHRLTLVAATLYAKRLQRKKIEPMGNNRPTFSFGYCLVIGIMPVRAWESLRAGHSISSGMQERHIWQTRQRQCDRGSRHWMGVGKKSKK